MKRRRSVKQTTPRIITTAGTIAALTLGTSQGLMKMPPLTPNPHWLSVMNDLDQDKLTVAEELALGYDPNQTDQNHTGTPDGQELACICADLIKALPEYDPNCPTQLHQVPHMLRGLEWCDTCGESVNMGTVDIENPVLDLTVTLSYISLHYMEHGSFSFAGDLHTGRVDVPRLLRTLQIRFPEMPDPHQQPSRAIDLDQDQLTDHEELDLGLNLYHADQNHNLIPDGPELARTCSAALNTLPIIVEGDKIPHGTYILYTALRGLETCQVCGIQVNMGSYEIINPKLNQSMSLPVIACHALEHGSFTISGSIHASRINILKLLTILDLTEDCGGLLPEITPDDK